MKSDLIPSYSLIKTIGRYQSLIGIIFILLTANFAALSQSETLRINEFMALNSITLADEDGDYSDWIEIYNPTPNAIDLLNWSLTDDKTNPQKWKFPQVIINTNCYIVLFASGKNRTIAGQELHTNFKLAGSGEYFDLFDPAGNVVTEFDPSYPEQQSDISFGYFENDYVASTIPTPGEENQFADHQLLPPPVFSYKRGFYEAPFEVEIISNLSNAQVYYTTDGSEPKEGNWTQYSAPVQINRTTVLRAITVKSGYLTSKITTHTYLFLADVLRQTNNPAGYPAEWGSYTAISGTAIADYEMDQEIVRDPQYGPLLKNALLSIPTLSIVTDKENLFSKSTDPETGGIYIYTGQPEGGDVPGLGDGWERPTSVEFFTSEGAEEFQVDCGIRLQGGHSRRPEKSPKHSFRLVFKSKYGPPKLNYPLFGDDAVTSFNTITLRAGFGNSFIHWSHGERRRAQYVRDIWAKDTQLAMGHLSGHGRYVHLYMNGIYWGIYNPTERIDREFATSYLGGDDVDFDVIKDYTRVVDGNLSAWNKMMSLANSGLANVENYQRIQGKNPDGIVNPEYEAYVDVVNLIDFMILNFYSGNSDWDHHNWVAVRNRLQPGKGFIFFSWDAEHILEELSHNMLDENNANRPSRLFQRLRENAEFRRLFVDRVQLHCFNGGVLTPEAAKQRWMKRANEIELAVIAESARWGDYRRDVHPYRVAPYDLYTKEYWLAEQAFLLNQYFPNRTNEFISQLKQANLFPAINAPKFLINGQQIVKNTINIGDTLTMTTSAGTIYYTIDGTDPFLPDTSQQVEQIELFAENVDKRVVVPKRDIGNSWKSAIHFDDSDWQLCSGAPGGIGYEKGSGYENVITLDVGNDMHNNGTNPNNSCYVRIKFNLETAVLQNIKRLMLYIRYDDGFVAYLNNTKVAEANVPATPLWNSAATSTHEAAALQSFNISQYINNLVEGENLLAIQAMNRKTSSTDFIINGKLLASDQNLSEGNVSPNAIQYSEPIELIQSTHVKARTFDGNQWSALNDMIFVLPADLYNLKITEIHYHPLAQDSIDDRCFEFIELKNIGVSPLDLSGVRFCNGITYSFPVRTILKANEIIVLASDRVHFADRYDFAPYGEYEGFLDNAGERIVLINVSGDTVISIRYNDKDPWPVTADGEGYSLVPKDPNPRTNQNDPANWQVSHNIHGSPGKDDEAITIVESKLDRMPNRFQLDQNYPNPFNPTTKISYLIPKSDFVTLKIYDILGREIQTLVNEYQKANRYSVDFNANGLASGVYFYRIKAGGFSEVKKLIIIK